jgi:hypothetical protein
MKSITFLLLWMSTSHGFMVPQQTRFSFHARLHEAMDPTDSYEEEKEEQVEEDYPPQQQPQDSPPSSVIAEILRQVAQWSLQDYAWRSNLYKTLSAERLLEQSLARLRGIETPGYLRPMDAPTPTTLGAAESASVQWMAAVIEEEGIRARRILQDGSLVRPMAIGEGPLAEMEQWWVGVFKKVKQSELLRRELKIARPKDLEEGQRGPLGDAEYQLYQALRELSLAENTRYQVTQQRNGTIVRPMDVPGPLGEVEAAVMELFQAEQRRVEEQQLRYKNNTLLRPMNAALQGPLGRAEEKALQAFQRLSQEEQERLHAIFQMLQENRPMERHQLSWLGWIESLVVGLLRAPRMMVSVWERVQELLQSETLSLPPTEKEDTRSSLSSNEATPRLKMTELKLPSETDSDLGAFE